MTTTIAITIRQGLISMVNQRFRFLTMGENTPVEQYETLPGYIIKFVEICIWNLVFCLTLIPNVKNDGILQDRSFLVNVFLAQNLFIERLTLIINLIRT